MTDEKKEEGLPLEVQDIIRGLVSAIRAIKLYPPNNPIYSQSLTKSHHLLTEYLETKNEFALGIQNNFFLYEKTPLTREGQLNRAIVQDLYAKGVRELAFNPGITRAELLDLFRALALPREKFVMKSGLAAILWEKGARHIRVTESGLDEIITAKTDGVRDHLHEKHPELRPDSAGNLTKAGRTLVLSELMNDPSGFGARMLDLARQGGEHNDEDVNDRLYALYREAGRKIEEEHHNESDVLFHGLANSALSLESPYRETLIAGKLYEQNDSEIMVERKDGAEGQVPSELQEVLSGRFTDAWPEKHVALLLKKVSAKKQKMAREQPFVQVEPVPQDLLQTIKEFALYSPEEMKTLKSISEAGMEPDIIEAATRTLLFMLPLFQDAAKAGPEERERELFSSIVRQLEDMVVYLLQNKNYEAAMLIIRALHAPVQLAFRQRMAEAIRKTSSRSSISRAIGDLKQYPNDSPEYRAAYSYLAFYERASTETVLELLAEEADRDERVFLMELLKDVGKNQISFIGEHVSDERWYLVRNVVSILGKSKADEAVAFLYKAAGHKNIRIRQEVIKGLITIGGRKAAALMATFLRDRNAEIKLMAIRGLTEIASASADEIRLLLEFLRDRPVGKRYHALTLEAIRAAGKIGDKSAAEFLAGYDTIRWWRPGKLQRELRTASLRARGEIKRRGAND